MQQAVVDAAIMFCEDSQVVRTKLDTIATLDGVASYELIAPTQQQIGRIQRVWVDDRQISVVPSFQARQLTHEGRPEWATTRRDGNSIFLVLYPTPDQVFRVDVEVSTLPARNAQSLEDDLLNYWLDAIVAGATSRLMAIPNQAFTNLAESIGYGSSFAYLTRKAKLEAPSGRTVGSLRVKPRRFT